MSQRDPTEVLDIYARSLQIALHCVTAAKIRRPSLNATGHATLLCDRDEPIRLVRSADRRQIFFEFRQSIHVDDRVADSGQSNEVSIEIYEYKILDSRRQELFVFHWHPASRSEATWPHVHIGSVAINAAGGGMEAGFYEHFSRLHVPTGLLVIEQVVRFLITELQVTPLRDDWDVVLQPEEHGSGQIGG